MTDLVTGGWLWLTDGTDYLKVQCRDITPEMSLKPMFIHAPGPTNFSYDMKTWYWVFKVSGLLFDTYAKYTTFMQYLLAWQADGTFTLSIVRNTSSDKWAVDGTNTTYTVRLNGKVPVAKIAPENGAVYEIPSLTFEEG